MALVPVLLVAAGLAVFVVALVCAVLSGDRAVVKHGEDYRVASAAESVVQLSAEHLWTRYLLERARPAGDLASFREFLDHQGIPDSGPGGAPAAHAGKDLLGELALHVEAGRSRLAGVELDAVRVVRRDTDDATRLFLTVHASATLGDERVVAAQRSLVYTASEDPFQVRLERADGNAPANLP